MKRLTAPSLDFRIATFPGWLHALGFCALLSACGEEPAPAGGTDEQFEAVLTQLALPAGSRLPRFAVSGDRLLLSYVVSDTTSGDRLYLRERRGGEWTDERVLATGDNWFVNWADYPSVRPLGDSLFYHYLAYSGEGTYDYDIRFAVGGPGREAQVMHTDGVSAEHGFVSSASLPDGNLQVTWLDGRNTKTDAAAQGDHHGHHGGGAMTLRTATVHPDGTVSERTELDNRVCDCCNTATAATPARTMVVYRDRSEDEVRDISFVTRGPGGDWSEPRPVSQENWTVTGCPVNGPALSANAGGEFAVAWYTAADGVPAVRFARYDTAAGIFGEPVLLDDLDPLGRLDLRLDDAGTAYVLGLAGGDERVPLTLWVVGKDASVNRKRIAMVPGGRSTGFPRLALDGDRGWVAYTDTEADRIMLSEIALR